MKVLALTNMYPEPDRPWFGSFVRDQVEDLRELGVEIDVVIIHGTHRRMSYLEAVTQVRRAVERDSFDLVHAHYGLSGAVALAQRRVPVITTFHGSDVAGPPEWHRKVAWVVARLSTSIFVSPEGPRRVGMSSAFVIPAGVDCQAFRPIDRVSTRLELGWDPRAPYALLLGARENPVKRSDLFDAAVKAARKVMPELRAITLEKLTRREVVQVMNAADVSVLTSDSEGSPVAVRESLAVLTPVVSVDAGDVRLVLAGLPGCAVVDRDPAAIGDAIVARIGAERNDALRLRALESARPKIAKRIASVYESVIAQNGN
jgi:teichuronic acid biosynthesis glycosyltransferase TuaC